MEFNNTVKNYPKTPVEHHDTAAWANEEHLKPVSRVNIPSEMHVIDAKEYVEENQK